MRADPYYVSRLVGTAKGDLRLLSRVMDMRGPTKVYCEGEYFDLLAGAHVQIYTRSDETKPMRWFKGKVKFKFFFLFKFLNLVLFLTTIKIFITTCFFLFSLFLSTSN